MPANVERVQPWREVEAAGALGSGDVRPARLVGVDGQVLLVRDGSGTLHATGTACPHLGQPLADAEVEGGRLMCSHHGYTFDLRTGACVAPDGGLAGSLVVHEVREVDGHVEVRLTDDGPVASP